MVSRAEVAGTSALLAVVGLLVFSAGSGGAGSDETSWESAADRVGEFARVCGPVQGLTVSDGATFVNVGADYPNPDRFTIVAFGDVPSADGSEEADLLGSQVCVSGAVVLYEGVAQILVPDLDDLERPGDTPVEEDDPTDDIAPGPY